MHIEGYDPKTLYNQWKELERRPKAVKSAINERGKGKITPITSKTIQNVEYVEVPGWSKDKNIALQDFHKQILTESMKNNDCNEVSMVATNDFSRVGNIVHGSDSLTDISTRGFGVNIIVGHNHPRNATYSLTDLLMLYKATEINTFTIVKNNGKVEAINGINDNWREKLKLTLRRQTKKQSKSNTPSGEELDKAIRKTLKKLDSEGVLSWKR